MNEVVCVEPSAKPVPTTKEVSLPPAGRRRATPELATPLSVVKLPPAERRPSAWATRELTVPLRPVPLAVVNAVSGAPVVKRRATRLVVTALSDVKEPPTAMRPSGRSARAFTWPPKPEPKAVAKAVSSTPSAERRATRFTPVVVPA